MLVLEWRSDRPYNGLISRGGYDMRSNSMSPNRFFVVVFRDRFASLCTALLSVQTYLTLTCSPTTDLCPN